MTTKVKFTSYREINRKDVYSAVEANMEDEDAYLYFNISIDILGTDVLIPIALDIPTEELEKMILHRKKHSVKE